MASPKTIAIIPARGGSKGIPRKNIRLVAGKPLLVYSIEQARQTPTVSRVVVSTDDGEIAGVARNYGAEVIWRPLEISGDTAASESALLHTLDHLRDTEKYEPELVVFLQCTSPLRQPADIGNAIETLKREKADSLFSARHVEGFVWRSSASGLTPANYDPIHRPRRQDLKEFMIEENGSIYVFKPSVLRQFNSRLGGKIATYIMDPLDSYQVDQPGDLSVVEALLAMRKAQPPVFLRSVRLLVLDFDGVMTDNRVWVGQDGREAVACNRSDGWGISHLREKGVEIVVLSTETNPVVEARCRKLHIVCVQACADKLAVLREMAQQRSLLPENVAYVGNDVNDLECMRWVGVPIAVADAVPEVRVCARLMTSRPGGYGAVREVTDWLRKEHGP